jgi:hypothetical protein
MTISTSNVRLLQFAVLNSPNIGIANGKDNKCPEVDKKNPPKAIYAWGVRKALSGVGLLLRGGIEPGVASEGEDSPLHHHTAWK